MSAKSSVIPAPRQILSAVFFARSRAWLHKKPTISSVNFPFRAMSTSLAEDSKPNPGVGSGEPTSVPLHNSATSGMHVDKNSGMADHLMSR